MNLHKLSDTTKKIPLFMADSSSPTSGKTGLTVTVRVSKNGAAFGAGSGTVTELEGGVYSYAPASGDVDTLGPLVVRATASGAVDFVAAYRVVAFDPYAASNLGLSNLDAAVSSRSTYAGADTSGTTTLLARLTSQRAANLDNLDAAVSTRSTFAGGAVASVTGNVGGNVAGSVASVTAAVTVADKTGFKLASDGVDAVVIETGVNLRQAVAVIGAACAGKASGLDGSTAVYYAMGASGTSTARITATTTGDGNRTTIALSLPS